jgi:hypothetical protein
MAPLNKIAAHKTDYSTISVKSGFYPVDLFLMSQVKGVIFADDANDFQNTNAFSQIFSIQGLRIWGK